MQKAVLTCGKQNMSKLLPMLSQAHWKNPPKEKLGVGQASLRVKLSFTELERIKVCLIAFIVLFFTGLRYTQDGPTTTAD